MSARTWFLLIAGSLLIPLLPLLGGYFYGTGDTRDVYLPLELFFQQELRAGRLPSWNPDMAWGYPVIAAAQIGFFYPPLLLGRLLAPVWLYLPALVLAHIVGTSFGTYLFARPIFKRPQAAYLAAISFSLSQFLWQHLTHLNILLSLAWLPWQLLAVRRIAKASPTSYSDLALAGLALGTPFLVGQLQIPFFTAALAAIYFLYVRWRTTRHLAKPLLTVGFLTLLAAGIASAQLFPTFELAQHSSRRTDGTFSVTQANQHSFPLYHVHTALFPRFFGNDDTYWGKRLEIEYGFFIGTIPLLLSLYAITTWRRHPSFEKSFWSLLAVITFLLALGNLSPVRLLGFEPSLWIFSAPARWLALTTFAGALLAGFGYQELRERTALFRRLLLVSALGCILVIVIVNMTTNLVTADTLLTALTQAAPDLVSGKPPAYYQEKLTQILHSLTTTGVSVNNPYTYLPLGTLLGSWYLLKRRQPQAILGLVTTELILVAAFTSPLVPWSALLSPPATISQLPTTVTDRQARLLTISDGGDTGAFLTNPTTRATAATRATQKELLVPLTHAQFDIPGVAWPASLDFPEHSHLLDRIKSDPTLATAAQYNIGAVTVDRNLEQPDTAPTWQTAATALYIPQPTSRAVIDHPTATASYHYSTPTTTEITVTTPEDATMTVYDSWYPGWKATLDNTEIDIHRSSDRFRILTVPAGTHTVTLTYHPRKVYLGIAISLVTGILLIITLNSSRKITL